MVPPFKSLFAALQIALALNIGDILTLWHSIAKLAVLRPVPLLFCDCQRSVL